MKLMNNQSNTILKQNARDQDKAPVHDWHLPQWKLNIQENYKLLKETKREASTHVITVNGEIYVRESVNEDHIALLCKSNLIN